LISYSKIQEVVKLAIKRLNVFSRETRLAFEQAVESMILDINNKYFASQLLKADIKYNESVFGVCKLPKQRVFDTEGVALASCASLESHLVVPHLLQCNTRSLDSDLQDALTNTWQLQFFQQLETVFAKRESEQWAALIAFNFNQVLCYIAITAEQLSGFISATSVNHFGDIYECVKHKEIAINVALDSHKMNFTDILNLAPGMVIPLKQRVDKPLKINLNKSSCNGFLVENKNQKSIYLVK